MSQIASRLFGGLTTIVSTPSSKDTTLSVSSLLKQLVTISRIPTQTVLTSWQSIGSEDWTTGADRLGRLCPV